MDVQIAYNNIVQSTTSLSDYMLLELYYVTSM